MATCLCTFSQWCPLYMHALCYHRAVWICLDMFGYVCVWSLARSSVTLVQSYLKGSVKLCDTNAAKYVQLSSCKRGNWLMSLCLHFRMLKHLSLILKAHTLHGINLVVETAAGASEQDTHDTLTMNIFQSILLVHGIALSLKVTDTPLICHTSTVGRLSVELSVLGRAAARCSL